MEVEMKIRDLMMDATTNMPVVVLKEVLGDTVLPIWVGINEANAIALELQRVAAPRPMTHDLIKILLMSLETAIQKVVLNDVKDDTFYALIWLEREGSSSPWTHVPATPSRWLCATILLFTSKKESCSSAGLKLPQKELTMKNCGSGWRTWMTKTWVTTRCDSFMEDSATTVGC